MVCTRVHKLAGCFWPNTLTCQLDAAVWSTHLNVISTHYLLLMLLHFWSIFRRCTPVDIVFDLALIWSSPPRPSPDHFQFKSLLALLITESLIQSILQITTYMKVCMILSATARSFESVAICEAYKNSRRSRIVMFPAAHGMASLTAPCITSLHCMILSATALRKHRLGFQHCIQL